MVALHIRNNSIYYNQTVNHYCIPDYFIKALHLFWPRGIDADLASNDIANYKIQAQDYWTDTNKFNFNKTSYLGDAIWCFPPYTEEDSRNFLQYIIRAKQNKQFKEALILLPTSINGIIPMGVLDADELFYSKQINGYNYRGNIGHYLAYFTNISNRSDTIEQLFKEYFWRA